MLTNITANRNKQHTKSDLIFKMVINIFIKVIINIHEQNKKKDKFIMSKKKIYTRSGKNFLIKNRRSCFMLQYSFKKLIYVLKICKLILIFI